MTFLSRLPYDQYAAIPAMNVSRLKELKRSPQHYLHRLTNAFSSKALTLGTAAHCATLEPERFDSEFVVWDRRTESGRAAPRTGKGWEAFQAEHTTRTILAEAEAATAKAIAAAVRADTVAGPYLVAGDPEVSFTWTHPEAGRACKARADWITTIDGFPVLVGLKTARDCRHFQFGAAAARLGYHLQWAWYFDGFFELTGKFPRVVEIVVESEAPHAVATYVISDDILAQGRDEYMQLLALLAECEASGIYPGPVPMETVLSLPSWAYATDDDISELGLEV